MIKDVAAYKEEARDAALRNKDHVETMLKKLLPYFGDPQKEFRKKQNICRYCFYISSHIGGQVLTATTCRGCGQELMFATACTDKFCNECAAELKMCKECGQRMD